MAVSAGDVVLSVPSCPRRSPAHAVPPTVPSQVLGSDGSLGSGVLDSGMSPGPSLVASSRPSDSGCVSPPGVTRPGLLVRRFRRRLRGSPGHPRCFRPLGRGGLSSAGERQSAFGGSEGSPSLWVLSVQGHYHSVLRQQHCGCLPAQGRGHSISVSQRSCPGDPEVGRVAQHPAGSSVHSAYPQCPGGLSLPAPPTTQFRVVPEHGGLSIFTASMACDDRPLLYLRQSEMFTLFLALPRSSVGRYGRPSPVLGRSPSLRFSAVVHSSPGSGKAQGVEGCDSNSHRSLLASASVFHGPPPDVGGSSGGPSQPPRPSLPASVSSVLPGSPQAGTSCLETVRRFTRAAGFYSAVASQAALARRPSSRTNHQLKWSVYRTWCCSHGHSISLPSLSKVADFLWWLRPEKKLSVSSIRGYRSMLSVVFRFHLPNISTHPVLRDLVYSFRVSSLSYPLRRLAGTSLRCFAF